MPIQRQDMLQHLERQVRTEFTVGNLAYSPLRGPFVREYPSDGSHEKYADMGHVPWPTQNAGKLGDGGDSQTNVPKVNRINAGEQITVWQSEERGLDVYNVDYEISIGIAHNLIDDDRSGQVVQWSRDAGLNFEKHSDFLAFDALNQGAGTTYGNGYDDLTFFNDSHIDPGAEYQTAQDNSFALSLTLDNYETNRVAASKFLDSRGQPMGLTHNLLIVPPDLFRLAAQIVGNNNAYDTANNEINPYVNVARMIVAPGTWLDTTAWFLVDDSMTQKPINMQMRKSPQLVMWDDETAGDGGVRYFKWHSRKAVFYGDWRLCAMGNT